MQYRTSICLDVHARSIAACALDHLTGEIVEKSFSEPVPQDIVDWAGQFEPPVRATYETGPTGFALARALNSGGPECVVAATSRMLRPSGERVKTDRRDARFLAKFSAQRLQRRGKKGCVVNVAVARELAGWVWALATM